MTGGMLSVVVPTLNAAATLGPCLDAVREADEIVVVDGGSTDGSTAIAQGSGARLVQSPRGRGVQLAAGAAAAKGDWLLFLHADTRLSPGWREAAERHRVRCPDKAACFRFRLDAGEKRARLVEAGVALRVRLLGLPYGDQGLLVPRRLYDETGGYRPLALMEDVDLVRRIGARRIERLGIEAVTSAARWRSGGWLRRSARNLLCLVLYRSGMSPERVARLYG
ncbi:MAG TPA: TIGR04283 family arsenosugar biosynthesis glycosyltransferase [Allosphingosinicella sp.]|nr:TIGR04283 family arsenosugar biosynthesis glycosyltransferase [Allosphingosinicella sp.]